MYHLHPINCPVPPLQLMYNMLYISKALKRPFPLNNDHGAIPLQELCGTS